MKISGRQEIRELKLWKSEDSLSLLAFLWLFITLTSYYCYNTLAHMWWFRVTKSNFILLPNWESMSPIIISQVFSYFLSFSSRPCSLPASSRKSVHPHWEVGLYPHSSSVFPSPDFLLKALVIHIRGRILMLSSLCPSNLTISGFYYLPFRSVPDLPNLIFTPFKHFSLVFWGAELIVCLLRREIKYPSPIGTQKWLS